MSCGDVNEQLDQKQIMASDRQEQPCCCQDNVRYRTTVLLSNGVASFN